MYIPSSYNLYFCWPKKNLQSAWSCFSGDNIKFSWNSTSIVPFFNLIILFFNFIILFFNFVILFFNFIIDKSSFQFFNLMYIFQQVAGSHHGDVGHSAQHDGGGDQRADTWGRGAVWQAPVQSARLCADHCGEAGWGIHQTAEGVRPSFERICSEVSSWHKTCESIIV